jgi:predicted aldo/keto reductase-like oxidoreductase
MLVHISKGVVEIPVSVLSSVETLDELQDWLTAQNPQIIAELREAHRQDLAGEFKTWEPCHVPWPTGSK